MPLTIVLELIAICIALSLIATNNALLLLFGIRALRSTGICIRLATRLAGIGLT